MTRGRRSIIMDGQQIKNLIAKSGVEILLCVKSMHGRISLFGLATLLFELYLPDHHLFLVSSDSENQKPTDFIKPCFLKNRMDNPP
jgi:hypothetical protein